MAETPRYQVFISSTYKDLKTARAEVQDVILRLKHFPIGMELFPATGDTPWELIERVIAESDYYVLIVGGRYGSLDENGISFTEREYNLALKLNKRILVFLHANPDDIPRGDTETDPAAWDKLSAFRSKIGVHHRNTWTTVEELKLKVMFSLVQEITDHPMSGWIRNQGIDTQDILRRLADLQSRYDTQSIELSSLKQSTAQLEQLAQSVSIDEPLSLWIIADKESIALRTSVGSLFLDIGQRIIAPTRVSLVRDTLREHAMTLLEQDIASGIVSEATRDAEDFHLHSGTEDRVALELVSRDLVRVDLRTFPSTGYIQPGEPFYSGSDTIAKCWQLTEKGSRLLKQLLGSL